MRYKSKPVAICLGDTLKVAALYYSHILPFAWTPEQESMADSFDVFDGLVPPGTESLVKSWQLAVIISLAKLEGRNDIVEINHREIADLMGDELADHFRDHAGNDQLMASTLIAGLKFHGIDSVEFVLPASDVQMTENYANADPCLVLSRLKLVDVKSVPWEKISSIRSDTQSMNKLRRLRTFVFEEFDGKPIEYIEDKLGLAIEDHAFAAKKHGLTLRDGALSVMSSEKVFTGAAAGLLAAITGVNIPLSAALGSVTALAGALFEVGATRRNFKLDESQDQVRYLIDIHQSL